MTSIEILIELVIVKILIVFKLSLLVTIVKITRILPWFNSIKIVTKRAEKQISFYDNNDNSNNKININDNKNNSNNNNKNDNNNNNDNNKDNNNNNNNNWTSYDIKVIVMIEQSKS